jgi:hypothetical protein
VASGQSILKTSLLDLLHALRGEAIPLILGGGYGLYLKQVRLQESPETPTVLAGELWPVPRATEDLDILLTTEVVVESERMRPIRMALDSLGYTPVVGAEYMQFVRTLGPGQHVKIDFLTGPLGSLAGDRRVKVDDRRVRPRHSVKLHAHRTDEALGFQEDTQEITVSGLRSCGQPYQDEVHVPPPHTLLLMKLHAFRDRHQDRGKDLGRHHALDIYRIVAMMTEHEFTRSQEWFVVQRDHPVVTEARRIVAEHFDTAVSRGAILLREHPLWRSGMPLDEFLSAIRELLPPA